MQQISIFWFRRDLRIEDNAGLYHALKEGKPVFPIFVFDKNILDKLEDKKDKRVDFIHQSLIELNNELANYNATLSVFYSTPLEVFKILSNAYFITSVYTNHDYEPYAKIRDTEIANFLSTKNIQFKTFKDQVIFEKDEIVKDDGMPYTVFTPYSKKWKAKLNQFYQKEYPVKNYATNFLLQEFKEIISLNDIGFTETNTEYFTKKLDPEIVKTYNQTRDYPAVNGTSKLSVHLRFGTVSIRQLVKKAITLNETYLNELIWRDFYQMILWHFPNVEKAFKPAYDFINWRNNETEFDAWCNGQTGYPIVDAGMRELNVTGYMHNRVRMIVASFLTKHLLIDWRWGEAYFAQKLLDFDLAANNGGWQWASGSGCDAAPYFRVFNPYLQTQKFDAELKYINKWVPEFQEFNYPKPIVEHDFARKRCLETYAVALKKD